MAGNESFLFSNKVGILEETSCGPVEHGFRDSEVTVRMAQNGFELRYQNMNFVANTLEGAMEMVEKWFKEMMEESKERDKEE